MLDRLRLGYVVDFVDVGIGDLRFYTFNVADSAISCAILLLLLSALLPAGSASSRPDERRPRARARGAGRCLTPRSPPGVRTLRVPDGRIGRIDRYVADVTGLSRSHVQKLISDGRLTADGRAPPGEYDRAGRARRSGSTCRSRSPWTSRPAHDIPLRIVYEDADLLIIDKPSGIVVHPSPGHHDGDTLVNALLARAGGAEYGGIAGVARPGIVHRLDRDTSGLLMVAKHDGAQASLMAQLKARRVRKTYLALVQGSVAAAVGRIEAPIGRDPKHRTRMAVVRGRARIDDRLPRPRAVRRLDAAGAGPRHRPDAPDPRPPRRDRPPGGGRPGLRDRHVAARTGGPGPAVPARLAAGADGAPAAAS